jgi:RHS repeat-associated protein
VGVPIRNTADYSPFGVQLDGRTIQGDFYRYGYQGSEKDDEAKGGGNSYTTFFRQLDPRVGRWFSIDPKMSAWESPYVSMGNNPVLLVDPYGDTIKIQGTDKNSTNYNFIDGKAYDDKGNEYKGGDAFVSKTLSELNKIKNGGSEGTRLINSFTTKNVNIKSVKDKFDFDDKTNSILIDLNKKISTFNVYGLSTSPAFVSLAHELAHAEDFNNGTIDMNIWDNTHSEPIYNAEKYAVHIENKIRAENSLLLRSHYADISYINIKGEKITKPFLQTLVNGSQSPFYSVAETIVFKTFENNTVHGSIKYTRPFDYNRDKAEAKTIYFPTELFELFK